MVRTSPGRGCSIATSRSASAAGMRPARRAAAKTASWAITTPIPSAATSGDEGIGRRERGSLLAAVSEDVDDEIRERAARDHAERAGEERDEQRFTGDEPPDLPWAGAECAQHGGLPSALGDGEPERPGDDEQGD